MLHRRALLTGIAGSGIAGAGLAGCATTGAPALPARPRFVTPPLAPIRLEPGRITKITVCTRPFRAAGPRLDVETVAGKRVVHNYGHGGSGWSLSWGSAAIAAKKALEGGAREVAVIGCGAIGLTSALTLQRAGAKVTIYAKDRTPYTRSARATGSWTPDSRIADADKAGPAFGDLWEQMARTSYAAHHTYLGLPGDPVAWRDRYTVLDPAIPGATSPWDGPTVRFAHLESRLADIEPFSRDLQPGDHPFNAPAQARVRRGLGMQFNVAELAHLLTTEFLTEGGHIEPLTFETPADLARLKEPVVVNCTGYGARALWKDDSITPVRGQIAWLAPQPEVAYSLYYGHVSVVPRPDGIVVQQTGAGDMWGYGIDNETPDRGEAEAAIATVAALFR